MNLKLNIIVIFYINNIQIIKFNKNNIKRIKKNLNIKFYIINIKLYIYYLNIIIKRDY